MKSIWNAFSFLAVVHLLALLIFAGWLWKTDRLEGARLEAVRDLFAMSIQEQADAGEAAKSQADSDQQAAEAEARLRITPRASSDQLILHDTIEQAKNLAVFTDYQGMDPEASDRGNSQGEFAFEYYNMPPPRIFILNVTVNF